MTSNVVDRPAKASEDCYVLDLIGVEIKAIQIQKLMPLKA